MGRGETQHTRPCPLGMGLRGAMPNKGGFLGGLRVGEPFLFYLLINLLFYLLISLSAGWGGGGTGLVGVA